MKTNVYIDGFNLYYNALKGTNYKWLNLEKLSQQLLPTSEINKIKYFTAPVKSRADDPDQATRQKIYFRALETLPKVKIILGHFSSHKPWVPMSRSRCGWENSICENS